MHQYTLLTGMIVLLNGICLTLDLRISSHILLNEHLPKQISEWYLFQIVSMKEHSVTLLASLKEYRRLEAMNVEYKIEFLFFEMVPPSRILKTEIYY